MLSGAESSTDSSVESVQESSRSWFIKLLFCFALITIAAYASNTLGIPKSYRGLVLVFGLVVMSWFSGFSAALTFGPFLVLIARLFREDTAERLTAVTFNELVSLAVIGMLCSAFGLAGQYRRKIRSVTEQHAQKLDSQAGALTHAPIVFRDVAGRITQWSEGAARLFGWSAVEAVGRTSSALLKTELPEPFDQIQSKLLEHGRWQSELVHFHRSGEELHVVTHWILCRDRRGNPIGVAEVHNDVTALRKAEAAVRDADRRKDEFLAVLAHELRNPLSPIRTGLELMKRVKDDPELIEQTRLIMERQMRQLVTLVDDLLDVSRISRGKLELRKDFVQLADVVRSAVEAVQPAMDSAGHRFEVDLPGGPLSIYADPHRLAQVISNLLDNAVKYTPTGGCVKLKVRREDDQAVISVCDNGFGISPKTLEHLFEMFTRGDHGSLAHPGLGIGLALVKSIVGMHDGEVSVVSDGLNCGSEFIVRLPIAAGKPSKPVKSDEAATGSAGGRKVLVVDDNQAAANLLSVLIQRLGHDVRTAYDGEEAVRVADEFRPGLVLMDLGMPRLDGLGAAKLIRSEEWGQDMVLVALTGWGQAANKQSTQEVGFDYHLVKPADPAEIRRLLAASRATADTVGPEAFPKKTDSRLVAACDNGSV